MSESRSQLEEGVAALGLQVSSAALDRFERYLHELLHWRERLNLTGAANASDIVGLHFIDSLVPLSVWQFPPGCRVVDVGSGAGFPGIPLRLVRQDLRLVLVDASRRRVAFLEHVRSALDIEDVEIIWARAEALSHRVGYRESFDAAVERATAHVERALELCLPFVVVGGAAILLKGPRAIEETRNAAPLLSKLGGAVVSCEDRPLPTTDHRRVAVVARKVLKTPDEFPRLAARLGRRA